MGVGRLLVLAGVSVEIFCVGGVIFAKEIAL